MSKSVIVIGAGDVGGHELELFARVENIDKIYVADINEQVGLRKIYSARTGAAHLGSYPDIDYIKLDLNNIDETADVLSNIQPQVVMHNATMMSNPEWSRLPKEITEKIASAGIANVVPLHLTLTYKLMKAVQKAKVKTHVVMSPYPDVVNAVLGKAGLAHRLIGLGNIDYIVPGLRKAASDKLRVDIHQISIFLIAPYAVLNRFFRFGSSGGLPYYLRVFIEDNDVTEKLNIQDLLMQVGRYLSLFTIYDLGFIAASSGVKNALAIINDSNLLTHAPGPLGLPGGYPIRLGAEGAEVALPPGITLQEAVKINEEAIKGDGIERIEDDGTLVFSNECVKTWRETLGYDCKELKLDDCEQRARELLSIHKRYAK